MPVRLKLYLPDISINQLEIIDLPGLISSNHNNHGQLNKKTLEETAKKYIKNINAIVLLVIDSSNGNSC